MNRSRPSRAKVKARRTRTSRRHFPRDAGQKPDLEEPEETFDQPAPKRQADYDADDETDPDKRKADSAFDDLYIEVDESELESELTVSCPAARRSPPATHPGARTAADVGVGGPEKGKCVMVFGQQHVNARDQHRAALDPRLVEDRGQVKFHGPLADAELVGDQGVGEAARDQVEDRRLARGQVPAPNRRGE